MSLIWILFCFVVVVMRESQVTTSISGDAEVFRIELEQEDDGRWIAEIRALPGVMAYGDTRETAQANVEALALRVLADRLEHGESVPELRDLFSAA